MQSVQGTFAAFLPFIRNVNFLSDYTSCFLAVFHGLLHRCPLLAAAARRTDVVCAVHEGMVAGIIRSRDDGADAELRPLRPEGGCLLHLRAAS